jgi:acetyl-CoA acetyltransferase
LPAAEGPWEWHVPFHEYSAVNLMAMQARRHMHQYGTTKEQLGWIALNARRHAALNDQAVLQAPMTMDDYLAAPMISEPLGRFDCDLPIDAAVGIVLSAADFVPDCPNAPVRLEAVGCANHDTHGWEPRLDFPSMAAKDAAAQMWGRTDLTPADINVAELYDGFTILTLSWLEALGICQEGEAGAFVDGGQRIGLGGTLPLNTYGGQLSAGRLHGFWLFHEAVLQLRGKAGRRQVPNAEVAITSAGGGFRCGCILLTT